MIGRAIGRTQTGQNAFTLAAKETTEKVVQNMSCGASRDIRQLQKSLRIGGLRGLIKTFSVLS